MRRLALLSLALFLTACDSNDSDSSVAEYGDLVTVAYEGRLTDGTVFDGSIGLTFVLDEGLIPGFRNNVIGMTVGEFKTFQVPPEEGYGDNPPPGSGIPAGATLEFDVELLAVR